MKPLIVGLGGQLVLPNLHAKTAASRTYGRGRPAGVNGQFAVPAGGHLVVPTLPLISVVVGGLLAVLSGVAHAVGLAVGDDDGGVVQQAVQDAGGGGVLGQEPSQVNGTNDRRATRLPFQVEVATPQPGLRPAAVAPSGQHFQPVRMHTDRVVARADIVLRWPALWSPSIETRYLR